jgi:hypothetical protein
LESDVDTIFLTTGLVKFTAGIDNFMPSSNDGSPGKVLIVIVAGLCLSAAFCASSSLLVVLGLLTVTTYT